MKKLPFILLFALVIVYLCACGAAGPRLRAVITAPPAETALTIRLESSEQGGQSAALPLQALVDSEKNVK